MMNIKSDAKGEAKNRVFSLQMLAKESGEEKYETEFRNIVQ
jgi:hypothetical protein